MVVRDFGLGGFWAYQGELFSRRRVYWDGTRVYMGEGGRWQSIIWKEGGRERVVERSEGETRRRRGGVTEHGQRMQEVGEGLCGTNVLTTTKVVILTIVLVLYKDKGTGGSTGGVSSTGARADRRARAGAPRRVRTRGVRRILSSSRCGSRLNRLCGGGPRAGRVVLGERGCSSSLLV